MIGAGDWGDRDGWRRAAEEGGQLEQSEASAISEQLSGTSAFSGVSPCNKVAPAT